MRVLWLCNLMLPVVAKQLGLEASNKEGWLSGLADVVLKQGQESGIELAAAFPAPEEVLGDGQEVKKGNAGSLVYYGFREDTVHPDLYDTGLEKRMKEIADDFCPELVHCFGTEYPHTLAMCRIFPQKDRLLIGIQGLCALCANAYFSDLPEKVIRCVTLRDFLKKDSIVQQQQKYVRRGQSEIEALKLAGNISGRTAWDKYYAGEWNPQARYYYMNETLRPNFYEGVWEREKCIPYSIFLSQGDYPIKGLHYMVEALPTIRKVFPKARVYVAGNSIVRDKSLKDKLKISAYGRYLKKRIRENGLKDSVIFLGKLDAEQMREQYLKSHLFVCCSSVENSPNSLGEAMLLGVPCVSADVGGIPSIFRHGEDGILYRGFRTSPDGFDGTYAGGGGIQENGLAANGKRLAEAVIQIWQDDGKLEQYCKNAREHAGRNHDRQRNYERMNEIYSEIIAESGE